jgi:hypothetical protein
MDDGIDIEGLSKVTNILVVLGGPEKRDRMLFQFLQRTCEDGPRESELGNSQVQLIDHRGSPPQ